MVGKIAAVFLLGGLAHYLVRRLTVAGRDRIGRPVAAGVFVRLRRLATRTLLDLLPAAAFAVVSFGLLLLLWIINWAGASGEQVSGLFAYLSLVQHYDSLLKGLFDSTDVIYYLLFILTFLVLSIQRLDANRLPH